MTQAIKHIPHINSYGSATIITWPDSSYVMYYADTYPQEIHYSNGEWIKIVDKQVVEVHTMQDIETHAREAATKWHGQQIYGDKPYTAHLIDVRQVLSDFSLTGDVAAAAWLHDIVEDTAIGIDTIKQLFGLNVAAYVQAVSGVGRSRAERCASVYARLAAFPPAVALKLADRIANTENAAKNGTSQLGMYRKEYPVFRAALRPINHSVDGMWERLERVSV